MSPNPTPIRVGVVGLSTTGWAASALGPATFNSPYYKLTAISTTSAASAAATAQKYSLELGYPIKAYHGSTAHIAADPEVDMVIVSVRAPGHREAVIPVIDAGKDVFIEWPAGANSKETRELAGRVKEKGVRAIVGLQGQFSPAINKAKEIIESGKIGKVLSTNILSLAPRSFQFWGPRISARSTYALNENNGATVLDIAVGHQTVALTHILGEFASVSATFATMYPTTEVLDSSGKTIETLKATAADHIAVTGMLKSGAMVNFMWRAGLEATPGRKSFTWIIDGEEGSIFMEGDGFINLVDPKLYLNGELVEVESTDAFFGNSQTALEDFARNDQDKRTYTTFEDAMENRRILDAIYESAKEGKRVDL